MFFRVFFVLQTIFHIIYVHINALKGNKEERNDVL